MRSKPTSKDSGIYHFSITGIADLPRFDKSIWFTTPRYAEDLLSARRRHMKKGLLLLQNVPTINSGTLHFLKRKLTNKTAITKAAAMAVVPWAFIVRPQRLSSSLSMTQFSI
jgi:hypothetical protein